MNYTEIQETGTYYPIVDGKITRETSTVSQLTQAMCDELFKHLPLHLIQSIYVKGSRANDTFLPDSDLDISIISSSMSNDTSHLEKIIHDKFNIELDCVINKEMGLDPYERFNVSCVYGTDQSLTSISVDDLPTITKTDISTLVQAIKWCRYCYYRFEMKQVLYYYKFLIKRYLRLTMLTTHHNIFTRDLYWCQHFIAKEYPQFDSITKQLLQLYLNPVIGGYNVMIAQTEGLLQHILSHENEQSN